MEYEKLSKNALKHMYVSSVIWHVIIGVTAIVVWRIFFEKSHPAAVIVGVICVLLLVEMLVSPAIRYQRYRYAIDEECIDLMEGLILLRREIVPIERLHKIAIERGPIDRLFGLGKVVVTTAGGDVDIRYLELERAEKIAELLKHRINEVAVQERGDVDGR